MGRPRLTLLIFLSSLGVPLSAAGSQGAPARASYQPGRRPVYRLARLEVEPLAPDRFEVLPAERVRSASSSQLAADGRHSTGHGLVYSLNDENDGISSSQNRCLLPVSAARLAADPRHSSGSELVARLNAENDGVGELVAPGPCGHQTALSRWAALRAYGQMHLAQMDLGARRRPAGYSDGWTGCGAQAKGAICSDRSIEEAAAMAGVERALSPARAAATAVARQSGLLVSKLARGMAEAATTLAAASRPAAGGQWAVGSGGRSSGTGREL